MANLSYALSRGKKTFQLHEECKFAAFYCISGKLCWIEWKREKFYLSSRGGNEILLRKFRFFKNLKNLVKIERNKILKSPHYHNLLHSISFGYFCIHFRCCSWHPRTFSFYRTHSFFALPRSGWKKKLHKFCCTTNFQLTKLIYQKFRSCFSLSSVFRFPFQTHWRCTQNEMLIRHE